MLINSQLVREILAAWVEDQQHPHKDRSDIPAPSEEDLSILLDTVFRASLLQEEAKPVSTSVAWISPTDFRKNEIPRRRESLLTLEFDAPVPFEARNLAKLAGIVNGKTGTLLAFRTESGARIWGICYFQRGIRPIGNISVTLQEARHFSPDCPTATVTGIGSLQITREGSVIGRVEGGKFLKAHATVLATHMLGQYLYRLIGVEIDLAARKLKNPNDTDKATFFMKCVEFLIEVLSQRRMGGIVIFIPPNLKERALGQTDTAWAVHGSLEVGNLLRARARYQKIGKEANDFSGDLFHLKVDQVLRGRLRSLVDLARVDGAILLTTSFEVIGFGMKLKSKKWNKKVEHGPVVPPTDKQELDFSRLGTRHNSALDYIGCIEGAVAFVASSDGPIRALVRTEEDKILYWPDCRFSMFTN